MAVAMVHGPEAGLTALAALDGEARLAGHHRLPAARAHVYEMAGDPERAVDQYRCAAGLTASLPEQRYLLMRAARLA
ncbi:hypothetical protein [Micromonospora sp. NPDC003241]